MISLITISCRNNMKKILAFSLIELMISLITISCIAAAFTPVITKRLKKSAVTMGLSEVTVQCQKFGSSCSLCYSDKCIACSKYCNEDEYKNVGKCECELCSERSEGCIRCDATSCRKCSAGYGLSDGKCAKCTAGYYSDGTTPCKPCPKGQYQNAIGQSSCKSCEVTKYQDEEGKSSCKVCPGGSYQDSVGQATCKTCLEDNYCINGSKYACAQNTGANSGSATCTACSSVLGACVECSNLSQCTKCSSGYYINSSNTCTKCEAGFYCNGTSKAQCSAGKYSSAGASSCSTCPAGKYSSAGATVCSSCQAGKWSSAGASSCYTCSAGWACNGSSTYQCPAGWYAPAGASGCTQCPAGTYSAAGASGCFACSSKWAYCTSCNNSACTACSSGYVLNGSGGCKSAEPSQADCNAIGDWLLFIPAANNAGTPVCATMFNVSPLHYGYTAQVNYVNQGTWASNNVCWKLTNYGCTTYSSYSGCGRVVCDKEAALNICSSMVYGGRSWRLPTFAELGAWVANKSTLQSLRVCVGDRLYNKDPFYDICGGEGGCLRSGSDGWCAPHNIHGQDAQISLSDDYLYGPYNSVGLLRFGFSVRCVTPLR